MRKTVRAFTLSFEVQERLRQISGNFPALRLLPHLEPENDKPGLQYVDVPSEDLGTADYDRLYTILTRKKNLRTYTMEALREAVAAFPVKTVLDGPNSRYEYAKEVTEYSAALDSIITQRREAIKRARAHNKWVSSQKLREERRLLLRATRGVDLSVSAIVEGLLILGMDELRAREQALRNEISERRKAENAGKAEDKSSKSKARRTTSSEAAA